jgi:rRNA maturation RNase YbeY
MAGVSIQNVTRRTAPRAAFSAAAEEILPAFDISLVFVTPAKARALNQKLRKKDYVPNVLSYSAGKNNGEIIICLSEAKKQAPTYSMDEHTFVLYLFIHGLLHLKGWAHSGTMERSERRLLAKFAKGFTPTLHETTHRNRSRHRNLPSKNGSGRRARR